MLTREQLNERLVDYLYDEMTADDRQAFELAVEQFPELRDEVAAHRRTREVMATYPLQEPPQASLDAIMRAARHEVAPPEASRSLWDAFVGLLMQPAFATAAIVAGIGMTAFFTMDGFREADNRTQGPLRQPVVAIADTPKPSHEGRITATEKADEVDVSAVAPLREAATNPVDQVSTPAPAPPAPSAPDPLVAQAGPTGNDVRSVLGNSRGGSRLAKAKKRRKQKRSLRQSDAKKERKKMPVALAKAALSDQSVRKELEDTVAPRRPASVAPSRVAEAARAPRDAPADGSRAAGASVTTHPGMGNTGTKSPANAEKRLRDRFNALVKAGKVAEAKRVLAEMEKLPSVSKARIRALRRSLADAQKAAPSKAKSSKPASERQRQEQAKPAYKK